MDYKKELEKLYLEEKSISGCPPENRNQFLGSYIFDFTTYDNDLDEYFAKKMIEVINAILTQTTFDYIKDESNYLNYITMCNMPFLKNKLEWGASIRGAWFDNYGYPNEGENKVYKIGCGGEFIIPKSDVNNFMKQVIEWSAQAK